jgi:hypothetical protein
MQDFNPTLLTPPYFAAIISLTYKTASLRLPSTKRKSCQ